MDNKPPWFTLWIPITGFAALCIFVGIWIGVLMTREERVTMRRDLDLYREIRSEEMKLPLQLREQLALEKKARAEEKAACDRELQDGDMVVRECLIQLGRKNLGGVK